MRALALVLLLGLAACDAGSDREPAPDPATRAVDPAPTEPSGPSGPSEYVEYGDTGVQPDLLPGGGAGAAPALRLRLRVAPDGCVVRRVGPRTARLPDGLAYMVNSRAGTVNDPRGALPTFRPRLRGTGVVALVVLDRTADGVVVQQVSNTVRVRCR